MEFELMEAHVAPQALAGLDTPADVIHPDIHDKVGDGSNANPNGKSPAGGNEIHGIGNVPGQNDDVSPRDGEPGFADQLNTVHGGISAYNPQAVDAALTDGV
jgi:hypothetical protein